MPHTMYVLQSSNPNVNPPIISLGLTGGGLIISTPLIGGGLIGGGGELIRGGGAYWRIHGIGKSQLW